MVKNPCYHSTHFDLKSWKINYIVVKNARCDIEEVINYFTYKFGKDLIGNNCRRPSFRQTKSDPDSFFSGLVTIPSAEPPSLTEFNSIDKEDVYRRHICRPL